METGLDASGVWAVRFAPEPHVKLGVVPRGQCWLCLDGHEPTLLREGDFYLLSNPPAYTLASDLNAAPKPATALWQDAHDAMLLGEGSGQQHEGSSRSTYVCGVRFTFEQGSAFILDALPSLVLVRAHEPRGQLLTSLSQLLLSERAHLGATSSLVLDHLAQLLLVQMWRAHAERTELPSGWLAALADDGVGAALRAMHGSTSRRWSLAELAATAGMSRSAFAATFKRRVGLAPLSYLVQWRMALARDALVRGEQSISQLASTTGYESESAFSTAFRRVVGLSPRHFRDQARAHDHSRDGQLARRDVPGSKERHQAGTEPT